MPWPITEFPPAPFLITSKKGSPNKGILGVIMKSHVMDMKFHPLNFMLMKSVNKYIYIFIYLKLERNTFS
jgi:hypothetical protein